MLFIKNVIINYNIGIEDFEKNIRENIFQLGKLARKILINFN